MGSLIGIRRRIKSTKNIAQITRAMQMVSASKMRKAQLTALATRPFTQKLHQILGRVASDDTKKIPHRLSELRSQKSILMILIGTTKGLCGGLNVNVYRSYANFVSSLQDAKISVVTIGRKIRWVIPGQDIELAARFDTIRERPTFEETRVIASLAMDSFLQGIYDSVYLVYPKFISTLTNEVTIEKLLPVTPVGVDPRLDPHTNMEYVIEPNPESLIEKLLPYQVEMSTYQVFLESRATEHSARMVAMKNASDNARDLIGSLTLDYNSARQSQVTSELLDVTTARMAIGE